VEAARALLESLHARMLLREPDLAPRPVAAPQVPGS
jgi:hypothetical protein